jgi:hypothetical protein
MAFFGGSAQDSHYLVALFAVNQPQSVAVLDTTSSTVTVNGARTDTNIPLHFHLHHAWLDKTGQYVILETTAPDRGSPNYAAPLYVWDTGANTFTALPESTALAGGHYATGFGMMVNQDCCTSTSWDAAQWQIRPLATPTANGDLIIPVLTPQEVYAGDHPSWNNAQPDGLVPFVTAFYRSASETAPWRPWDDEVVAVETGAGGSGATVWRFAHHRTKILSFWDTPRANVSQDGRWALFTSNWETTLGTDSSSGPREDVFMVELSAGDTSLAPRPIASNPSPPPPKPTPAPTPNPSPAPAPTPSPTPGPPASTTAAQPAQWATVVNATANGNSLRKTSGCGGCPDASGVAQQPITAGNGYVEFTVSETGTLRYLGLGSSAVGSDPSSIRFAFRLQAGTAEVREGGTYRSETSVTSGSVLRIAIESNVVKYSKDGSVFFTSSGSGYPLFVDALLYDSGATITNVMIKTGS